MKNLSQTYNTPVLAGIDPVASHEDFRKRWFLMALLLTTWAPLAFFIAVGQFETLSPGVGGVRSILLFLGTAHVPATLFFYTDKDFATIIRARPARYIYFPILLTVGAGLLVAFSNHIAQAYLFLGFWGWQAFHYGRQNVGVYSFVSIAQKKKPAHKLEKLAIDLGTICGILGTFKILGQGVSPTYLHSLLDFSYRFGRFGLIAVFAFGIFVYARSIKDTSLLKTIFFFTLMLFFLPVYLSQNINVTFLSYAIAHGLQYIAFMSIVSINSKPDNASSSLPYREAGTLLLLIFVAGFIFYRAGDLKDFELIRNSVVLTRAVDFVIGAILGATMAHFVIDAGAWRLSKVAQRTYMSKRFGFLFNVKESLQPQLNLEGVQLGAPLR